jgi:hypothetical protein
MSKEIDEMVQGLAGMAGHAMRMNIYGKPSDSRDEILADILHGLADHVGNKTLTGQIVVDTTETLFAFCQAARQEWEIIEP